ncbi:Phage integrase family protein OS=Bosea thiooxidans OX=53254 GN=SAMN05660750_00172 PE=4 SV=1 [Bosea thiooxidans]|uniref:Phage integrase family protein n=1 Tax=Bosea thiooxidans TaxID=53254 RepID=A0A1T5AG76_9HYPH|nr:site-specific integrase [Bosea thiooxidans]SKB33829.1 Phage integrase family protein [Bosea thiooxidans]
MNETTPWFTEFEDSRMWVVHARNSMPSKPPYQDELHTTPLSQFRDDTWEYPTTWASENNRNCLFLDFLGHGTFPDGTRLSLSPVTDAILIRQLKEALIALTYRRGILTSERTRVRHLRPTGVYSLLQPLRRLFVAFKRCGCRSLREVNPAVLAETLAMIEPSANAFDNLATTFTDLLCACRHGLISEGLLDLDFEISPPTETFPDLSGPRGWQPISDLNVSEIIRVSEFYVDHVHDIAKWIDYLRRDPESRRHEVLIWARSNLPCGLKLSKMLGGRQLLHNLCGLVYSSCSNFISFHAGLRVSELLSIKTGFISTDQSEAIFDTRKLLLNFTTYKTVLSLQGRQRAVKAHPKLIAISAALEEVRHALGIPGEYLFTPPGESRPYITKRWNKTVLRRFCELHNLDIELTGHRWRKTVAALAVRVFTNASIHLKELFGHASLSMTARYILASPFIREEIRDLTLDEVRKTGKTLLESLSVFGGPRLGGRHGKEMERRFSELFATDITEIDVGKTIDEFVEEMLRQNMLPIPVMPGVLCMKPANARGACATTSGDRLADPARCSAACTWQVQEAHRREVVFFMTRRIAQKWTSWSLLQQTYWGAQCRDQIRAWPELAVRLDDFPGMPTTLKRMILGIDACPTIAN